MLMALSYGALYIGALLTFHNDLSSDYSIAPAIATPNAPNNPALCLGDPCIAALTLLLVAVDVTIAVEEGVVLVGPAVITIGT